MEFKVGDRVRWPWHDKKPVGTVEEGPLKEGVEIIGGGHFNCRSYVVSFDAPVRYGETDDGLLSDEECLHRALLLAEDVIEKVEE